MVLRDHGVELAAGRAHEEAVRGQRPRDVDPFRAQPGHRGREHVDLLAPEEPSLAGVGVERRTARCAAPPAPSAGSSRWTRRTTRTTSSARTASGTDRKDRWIVTSATRSPPPTNNIATSSDPAASASISVWPGHGWPAAASDSLLSGAVTRASTRPAIASLRRREHGRGGGSTSGRRRAAEHDLPGGTDVDDAHAGHRPGEREAPRALLEDVGRSVDRQLGLRPLLRGQRLQDDLGADAGGIADGQRQSQDTRGH